MTDYQKIPNDPKIESAEIGDLIVGEIRSRGVSVGSIAAGCALAAEAGSFWIYFSVATAALCIGRVYFNPSWKSSFLAKDWIKEAGLILFGGAVLLFYLS